MGTTRSPPSLNPQGREKNLESQGGGGSSELSQTWLARGQGPGDVVLQAQGLRVGEGVCLQKLPEDGRLRELCSGREDHLLETLVCRGQSP